jgi:hypothetical protein
MSQNAALGREGDRATGALPRPRAKRRKITQACEQCRQRRVRCDGVKPACGQCAKYGGNGTTCGYSSKLQRDQSHDDYVASLLAHIHDLESGSIKPVLQVAHDQTRPKDDGKYYVGDNTTSNPLASVGAIRSGDVPTHTKGSNVDAMGSTVEDDGMSPRSPADYYGASSSISFLSDVHTVLGHRDLAPMHDKTSQPLGAMAVSNVGMASQFVLPPRATTDKLLDIYWRKVHHLYPFVHKPTFMAAYEQLWQRTDARAIDNLPDNDLLGSKTYGPESVIFHCALNIMIALSCHFLEPPSEEHSKLSTNFGQRARGLCHLDLFSEGSMAFIQTLLLIAQYLQSTQLPSRCWTCIGTACRLAQGIGLHVETSATLGQLDITQIDMRRRVWHGCVMLDAILSMTLGRPYMIHKHRIPAPDPQPIEIENGAVGENMPSTDFFNESIKLYAILREVITKFYSEVNDVSPSYDAVLAIDSALNDLESSWPPELQAESSVLNSPETAKCQIQRQQAFILQTRALHLRVLLHRPMFTRYCRELAVPTMTASNSGAHAPHASRPTAGFVKAISEACVANAILLIECLSKSIDQSATGAWWYNLFYARTASVVILLAMGCPSLSSDSTSLNNAMGVCREVLRTLAKISCRAFRCLQELEVLQGHILKSRVGEKQSHRSSHSVEASDASIPLQDLEHVPWQHIPRTDHFWSDTTNLGLDLDQIFDWEAFVNTPGL